MAIVYVTSIVLLIWHHSDRRINGGKKKSLGVYDTPEEAAKAFDKAAIACRGRDAITNFPVSMYDKEDPGGAPGQAAATVGTKQVPYQVTQMSEIDGNSSTMMKHQSIIFMPSYRTKSVEELRWEDYQNGVSGGQHGSPAMGQGSKAAVKRSRRIRLLPSPHTTVLRSNISDLTNPSPSPPSMVNNNNNNNNININNTDNNNDTDDNDLSMACMSNHLVSLIDLNERCPTNVSTVPPAHPSIDCNNNDDNDDKNNTTTTNNNDDVSIPYKPESISMWMTSPQQDENAMSTSSGLQPEQGGSMPIMNSCEEKSKHKDGATLDKDADFPMTKKARNGEVVSLHPPITTTHTTTIQERYPHIKDKILRRLHHEYMLEMQSNRDQ